MKKLFLLFSHTLNAIQLEDAKNTLGVEAFVELLCETCGVKLPKTIILCAEDQSHIECRECFALSYLESVKEKI